MSKALRGKKSPPLASILKIFSLMCQTWSPLKNLTTVFWLKVWLERYCSKSGFNWNFGQNFAFLTIFLLYLSNQTLNQKTVVNFFRGDHVRHISEKKFKIEANGGDFLPLKAFDIIWPRDFGRPNFWNF